MLRANDITGRTFGIYRVLSYSHTAPKGTVKYATESWWGVICTGCDLKRVISRSNLMQIHKTCKHWKDDLVGKVFTRLTVIKKLKRGAHGVQRWECLCSCGTLTIVTTACLIGNNTKSCGCWNREVRQAQAGILHPERSLGLFVAAKNTLYSRYSTVAKKRGYCFDLSFEQCVELWNADCHYCGAHPAQRLKRGAKSEAYAYNGIDRVDNLIGYTPANVVSSCGMCNRIKTDHRYDVFIAWVHQASANLRTPAIQGGN